MKLIGSTAFASLLSCGWMFAMVSGNGVPSPDMMQATSMEEFERLRAMGGYPIDEALKKEIDEHRRRTQAASQPLLASSFGGVPGFYHGVASGDPLSDAVVIWTRYTPVAANSVVTLELRMTPIVPNLAVAQHLDPELNPLLRRTKVVVTGANDWVAKIDVTGLTSYTNYIFAFADDTGKVSEVGQTKTAPATNANVAQLIYAVFSCSHFSNGYFHAYDVASTVKDLDFWIHVGDYFYEYGLYSTYASNAPERKSQILPVWETISLQDYRLRQATYHSDVGLRNLRRRAPMLAEWDDHETTNNAYGKGFLNNTGAENHQPVCPVNETATDSQKSAAGCDRDEGPADVRFTNAAQAFMEWIPLRRGPGVMGVVTTTSLTQVIEWGQLATVVVFDTRISYRSQIPTLASFFAPFGLAFASTNVSLYNQSPLREQFAAIAASVQLEVNNPNYTMIGDNIQILRNAFSASKAAGKPWQIWAGATMMATHIGPNLNTASELVPTNVSANVKAYLDGFLPTSSAGLARALVAMSQTTSPWNSDDFNGFGVERAAILDVVKTNSNNPIILGGDLHDSWAWKLYEGGNRTGTPVAVNLGVPGVTSPGWGSAIYPILQPILALLGGDDGAYRLLDNMFYKENPGLVYANTQDKGFFVVKATPTSHTAEFFHVRSQTLLQNYSTAYSASGKITANFYCGSSLVTTAGVKGSLDKSSNCTAIQFDTTRPAVWGAPFPNRSTNGLATLSNCGFNACTYVPVLGSERPSAAPSRAPVKVPVKAPVPTPVTAPVPSPVVAPIPTPVVAPIPTPVTAPVPTPVKAPVAVPVAPVPVTVPVNPPVAPPVGCGLFGFSLFCPLTLCGFWGRLFGLCNF